MYDIIISIIFQQQCDPNQFNIEETEVSFSSTHNNLVNDKQRKNWIT